MHYLVEAHPVSGFWLFLRFEDGAAGEIDLASRLSFDGVFAPLRDAAVFASVRLDPDLGTVTWPSGADLCPDVLHGWLTGAAPPAGLARLDEWGEAAIGSTEPHDG